MHRLWQAGGGYDRNLYPGDTIWRAIEYIEWNPVTRNLVTRPWAGDVEVPLRVDATDVILE
ncbi:MAG: hypothetical protein Kow0074_26180 [Candidatus Zixiibacteriota bacterium]